MRGAPSLAALARVSVLAAILLTVSGGAPAQSVAHLQLTNNDRVIALHAGACLQSPPADHVRFDYFGNMAFLVTSPCGARVMIDPWRNDPGIWGLNFHWEFPRTEVDVALVTHAHSDHDAIHRLDATMILDRMAGVFELGDVRITGIPEKHVCVPQGAYSYRGAIEAATGRDPCPPGEATEWNNVLFVIETGGLRILHWGDNRQNPPDAVWDRIGDIDVAILPIDDGGHILSAEWADAVIARSRANVVIPSHYHMEPLNNPHWFFNRSADAWVSARAHTRLQSGTLRLRPDAVQSRDGHVMYFGNHTFPDFAYPTAAPGPRDTDVPSPVEAWRELVRP